MPKYYNILAYNSSPVTNRKMFDVKPYLKSKTTIPSIRMMSLLYI